MTTKLKEPSDVLFRIKRGLAGYVSYLAACEMNEAFSEYILYEPILRILMARGFEVRCEWPCVGFRPKEKGDYKRIDFEVTGHGLHFAMEVKWLKSSSPNISGDYEKLAWFHKEHPGSRSFVCFFGRKRFIEDVKVLNENDGFTLDERGSLVYADFRKTRFGCRVFELKDS